MKKYEEFIKDGEIYFKLSEDYKQYIAKKYYYNELLKSNIPEFYWDVSFQDYIGEKSKTDVLKLQKIANDVYNPEYKNLHFYLYSNEKGTQKTAVASNFGKECLKQGLKVKFLLFNELIKVLLKNQGYNDNTFLNNELLEWYSADVLIVDEAFSEESSLMFSSKEANTKIYSEIDTFFRKTIYNNKKLIITSNVRKDRVFNKFGERIQSIMDRNFVEVELKDCIVRERKIGIDKIFENIQVD